MRVYIAGPMSGHTAYNFPAFDRARNELQDLGHEVVSPADLDRADGIEEAGEHDLGGGEKFEVGRAARAFFLRRDLAALLDCEALVLLDGWEDSQGANVELLVARSTDIPVYRWHERAGRLRLAQNLEPLQFMVWKHISPLFGRESFV